jgi:hypothetical protein
MDAVALVDVTLPWLRLDGPPVTKRLLFTLLDGAARFDGPALTTERGSLPSPKPG